MIRHAFPADHAAIGALAAAAFDQPDEAELIERLRAGGDMLFELVEDDAAGEIIGHILFSRLWADSAQLYAALAPVCVRPDRQRLGVGGRLIARGLEVCRELGAHAVVVLGHPAYYPRFGFSAQAAEALASPHSGSPAFMALALQPGALDHPLTIVYPDAFSG